MFEDASSDESDDSNDAEDGTDLDCNMCCSESRLIQQSPKF